MKSLRYSIIGASALLAASCTTTKTPDLPPPPPPPAATTYIASAHLDASIFLAPPPEAADAQRADLAAVEAAQALKNTPRWTLAQSDDEISPYSAFGAVLGPNFTKAVTPKTAALFDILFADVKSVTGAAKDKFARPRPPLADKKLETCMPLEKSKSYPSGHATRGWLMALTLSDMIPEKANEILARGREYGDSRVVCAEHYPSDVQAGRMVGAAIFAAARNDEAFERDYAAAKAETRAALGLPN